MYKTIRIRPPFKSELKAYGFERILQIERDEEKFATNCEACTYLEKVS